MGNAAKSARNRFIFSAIELGQVLGVSRQRVQQYVTEGMPRAGPNKYNLLEAIPWLKERWLDRTESKPLDTARIKESEARTQRHNIELELLRGTLVYTSDVLELLGGMATWTNAELESLAGRVQTDPKSRSLIADECRSSLGRVASRVAECRQLIIDRRKSRAATSTATEADG